MSTFAYGWITKTPTLAIIDGIASKMLAKVSIGESRHSKYVLEGDTTAVVTCRLASLIFTAHTKGDGAKVLKWLCRPEAPVNILRKKLKPMGWREEGGVLMVS